MWGCLDDQVFFNMPLHAVPDDFEGVLLDVPVGTGTFTFAKYRKLNKARIIAVDSSLAMLQKAQERYAEHGIHNVAFIRGNVANRRHLELARDLCRDQKVTSRK